MDNNKLQFSLKQDCTKEIEFWDWNFKFIIVQTPDDNPYLDEPYREMMYQWCIDNLGPHIGWHVRDWGVIIHDQEDAALFKLTWC